MFHLFKKKKKETNSLISKFLVDSKMATIVGDVTGFKQRH